MALYGGYDKDRDGVLNYYEFLHNVLQEKEIDQVWCVCVYVYVRVFVCWCLCVCDGMLDYSILSGMKENEIDDLVLHCIRLFSLLG